MSKSQRRVYTMEIEITATTRHNAELLRDEIVGAIEDNAESGEIAAEGFAGPLDNGRPEESNQ